MGSRGNPQDGDGAPQAVERRSRVRGPARDFHVVGLERGPLVGKQLPVTELSQMSFFVAGVEAQRCIAGGQYRLKLLHADRAVACTTECVRTESSPRVGAVFRLLRDEREAAALLAQVLSAPR